MSRRLLFAAVPRRLGGVASPPPSEPAPPVTFDHYVSPTGSSANPGTLESPWSLAYAASGAGGQITPGDTIGLLGGTYTGNRVLSVNATSGAPVIFRALPGARVTLVVTATAGTTGIHVTGDHCWLWGVEVTTTNTAPADSQTVVLEGTDARAINCIIHDTGGNGIGSYSEAPDARAYGCIIYNFGRQEAVPNFAHGIYLQNLTGRKVVRHNVIFNGFGYPIHGYTAGAHLTGIEIEDNTSFHSKSGPWLIGGGAPVIGCVFRRNRSYSAAGGEAFRLGSSLGAENICHDNTVTDNYIIGGKATVNLHNVAAPFEFQRNVFFTTAPQAGALLSVAAGAAAAPHSGWTWEDNAWGATSANPAFSWGPTATSYTLAGFRSATPYGDTDTFSASAPTVNAVFVDANEYEPGRGHVTIFNWEGLSTVAVDLSTVLAVGDTYEIRPVQGVFGAPVASGTYTGAPVAFPMGTYVTPAPPGGWPAVGPNTNPGPAFNVFLVTSAAG